MPIFLRRLLPALLSYAASGGSLITANIAQLLTFAILARALGAEEFGYYIFILAITSVGTHICGLGSAECLVRRVAKDRSIYNIMLGHNLSLIVASGAILIAIGMTILPFLLSVSDHHLVNSFSIFLLLLTNIVLVRLILLVEQIYIAHSDFKNANKAVIGFALARTAITLIAYFIFDMSTLAEWAIWQFAAHIIVVVIYFYNILPLGSPVFRIIGSEIKQGLYFSSQFVFLSLKQNADLLIISFIMPATMVGTYGIVRRLTDSSRLALEALNRLAYPRLVQQSLSGLNRAFNLSKKLLFINIIIAVLAALVMYIFTPILPIIFGTDYHDLVHYMRILCWLIIPMAFWAPPLELLGALGKHKTRSIIFNSVNITAIGLLAFGSWFNAPYGTFAAMYLIEILFIGAAWLGIYVFIKDHKKHAT